MSKPHYGLLPAHLRLGMRRYFEIEALAEQLARAATLREPA